MSTFQEITSAIESLPQDEYLRLVHWMRERDWQAWDSQLLQDAEAGKLDFLADEAKAEKQNSSLKEL